MSIMSGPRLASTDLLGSLNRSLNTSNPIETRAKKLKQFKKSTEGRAFVDWVTTQYTKCRQARSREVQQWNLNLAMYFGNQNVYVAPTGRDQGKLIPYPRQRGVERLVINRIRPMIRTELARLLSQKPAASVVPASSEDDDLMAAMAGEQVWYSLQSRRLYHSQFSKAAFWTVTTGTGFMKPYWDDTKEDHTAGQSVKGDIIFSAVQPYNLFVADLLEQDIEEQPYVLEVQVKAVEWLNYIFKTALERPVAATARAAMSILEDAYVQQRTTDDAKPDSAMVYEIWIKPGGCSYLPNGGYAMIVGSELVALFEDGLPYEHKEYPYAKIEHIPTSKFYGASVIEDTLGLNREYNKIRSQVADNRKKVGNIQFNAYKGSIIPEKVTNAVGQYTLVRPGMGMPTQVQPAQLPAYISENMDRVLSDIEDIAGQHQVSKGNVPPGITAATAISYLQERDDSLLTHTYQSIEAATEKVARQSLSLAVQFWDEERLIKIVGADGAFDTQLLKGSDLVTGTDVRIEAGSALPQSKAAKQALLTDFMKFGWIKPEDGLKMMEIGGAHKIFEQIRSDERQAQRENIRMKSLTVEMIEAFQQEWETAQEQLSPDTQDVETQQPLAPPAVVPVNSYDNNAVHIEVHNRYRRGQAFELLSPDIKAEFEAHVQAHKYAQMAEQMSMGGMMGMEDMGAGMSEDGGMAPEGDTGENSSLLGMMQQEGGEFGG